MKDATSRKEQIIERVAQRVAKKIDLLGPRVLNRPVGTVPVAPTDQKLDWATNNGNPDWWLQGLQTVMGRGAGPEQAALILLKRDQTMREEK